MCEARRWKRNLAELQDDVLAHDPGVSLGRAWSHVQGNVVAQPAFEERAEGLSGGLDVLPGHELVQELQARPLGRAGRPIGLNAAIDPRSVGRAGGREAGHDRSHSAVLRR